MIKYIVIGLFTGIQAISIAQDKNKTNCEALVIRK